MLSQLSPGQPRPPQVRLRRAAHPRARLQPGRQDPGYQAPGTSQVRAKDTARIQKSAQELGLQSGGVL